MDYGDRDRSRRGCRKHKTESDLHLHLVDFLSKIWAHFITRVLRLDRSLKRQILVPKEQGRILLLQGPTGPFFRYLQHFLDQSGFDCWRVSFNAGDRLFARWAKRIDFVGSVEKWERWLSSFLSATHIDCIILFGAERPVHTIARQIASETGIRVLCLEEGYIRPGFVTIEEGGNNATSPIAGLLPSPGFEYGEIEKGKDYRAFRTMCLYGATYYTARQLLSSLRERRLFHRYMTLGVELFFWARNFWRWMTRQAENFRTIERLLENQDGRYFFVPLQVSNDAQMIRAAYGWSNKRLISEALSSFARAAPLDMRLVFKIHPMERGHSDDRELIFQTAKMLKISDRIDVLDAGSIGLLTRHSAGMITINSTSGLSALYHGVPLLVIGNALYAHEALAVCTRGMPDFDTFWTGGFVADETLRRRYLAWMQRKCLKRGDFYTKEGIHHACKSILEKLCERRVSTLVPKVEEVRC